MASAPLRDVLLVGCGAVGAIYSLVLQRSGLARVSVVARSNFDIIDKEGIHFKSKKYGDISGWRPNRLSPSVAGAADRPYSYVVVTTKAIPELTSTSSILAPLLSPPYSETYPQPTYVLVQNGLNVEVDLYHALAKFQKGRPQIISTSLYIGTNLLEHNVVEHNDFDRLTLGMYRYQDYTTINNSAEEQSLLDDFAGMVEAGGTTVRVVPEIQREKFSKNFWNVAFSSYSTLTGYTLPALFRPPPTEQTGSYAPYVAAKTGDLVAKHTIPTIKATLEELLNVGRALGFPDSPAGLPSSIVETAVENTRKLHVRPDSVHKPSMLLDAEKNQPIEVEAIFGEVVRMAKERNVDIPRIETLYALLLVIQNQIIRRMEHS